MPSALAILAPRLMIAMVKATLRSGSRRRSKTPSRPSPRARTAETASLMRVQIDMTAEVSRRCRGAQMREAASPCVAWRDVVTLGGEGGADGGLGFLDRPGRHLHRHRGARSGGRGCIAPSCCRRSPEQYRDAALHGIRGFLGLGAEAAIPAERVASVKMGTTVATNALLERKGEPVVLVTTQGLGQQLRLAYQNRPRLFDRQIVLPEMLYGRVIEARERVRADGTVEVPLDAGHLAGELAAARAAGFAACAIVFVHGYRHQAHEAEAAALAEAAGFAQVSVSHRVSPLMKMVSRGDTTVVDAYLTPILRRYIDRVAAAFEGDMARQAHVHAVVAAG